MAAEEGRVMPRDHYLKVILLVLLNIFDLISTTIILAVPGTEEVNPFMDLVLRYGGWSCFFGAKIGAIAFACTILLYYHHARLAKRGTEILLLVYGFLSLYHSILIGILIYSYAR
jgi:hypothetical protein